VRDNADARVACLRGVARVVCRMPAPDLANQAARLPRLLGLTQDSVTRELIEAAAPTPQQSVREVKVRRETRTSVTYRHR
jgi:hypothetical protein